jgi:hypothetical protein
MRPCFRRSALGYDDDPAAVVNETVTIRASKTAGMQGARSRAVDVDVRLEALVDGVAIAGRQRVDYGGYGGMTVRMNPYVKEFSIRAVHPNPDKWRGDNLAIVQRVPIARWATPPGWRFTASTRPQVSRHPTSRP